MPDRDTIIIIPSPRTAVGALDGLEEGPLGLGAGVGGRFFSHDPQRGGGNLAPGGKIGCWREKCCALTTLSNLVQFPHQMGLN